MRTFVTIISLIFFTTGQSLGQLAKPKSYKLVLGDYTFMTETSFESDTLNDNSLREYSYLFKNDRQIIKIPRRIDTVAVYSVSDVNYERIEIDTVDGITVNKIVDTISKTQLDKLIKSELQIYAGKNKLKFDEAHLETIQQNGKTSFTIDLQEKKIKDGKHAFKKVSTLEKGGYLLLQTVWFYDLKGGRHEIECNHRMAYRIKTTANK